MFSLKTANCCLIVTKMFFVVILLTFLGSALSDEFCETKAQRYVAYNYADDLIVKTYSKGQSTRTWAYMTVGGNFIDLNQTDHMEDFLRGINSEDIEVVVTFVFNNCNSSQTFCQTVKKAHNLVIVQLKGSGKEPFPFKSFKMSLDGSFKSIVSRSEMPWNWPPNGEDISTSGILPKFKAKGTYTAAVFSPASNTMLAAIRRTNVPPNENPFNVMSRKLNQDGLWNKWQDLSSLGLTGLFILNNTLFGITFHEQQIMEFTTQMTYSGKGPVKEFFDCGRAIVVTSPQEKSTKGLLSTEGTLENQTASDNSWNINTSKLETNHTHDYINSTDTSDIKSIKSSGLVGFAILWVTLIAIFILVVGIILFYIIVYQRKRKLVLKPKDEENQPKS